MNEADDRDHLWEICMSSYSLHYRLWPSAGRFCSLGCTYRHIWIYFWQCVCALVAAVAGGCVGLWCKETSEAAKHSLRHRTALIERVIPPEIPVEPRLENPTF